MPSKTIFIPFGSWHPDAGLLSNDQVRVAANLVPVHGDYVCTPGKLTISTSSLSGVKGLEVPSYDGNGYALTNSGIAADLSEINDDTGVITNRTRTAAGNYSSAIDSLDGCSFGSNVICALFSTSAPASTEPIQYRTAGAARFANMVTSAFEPRAKFVFPFRNNLFAANCYVPAAFDTLAIGHYPRLVAWSQSDNVRQFGSSNATPQIIGADYQEVNFDIGNIVDAVSGADYAVLAMENGIVRIDGPPYSFRVITRNHGCLGPGGVTIVGNDIYFVSAAGLMRIQGGEGEPELLGTGQFARWFRDAGHWTVPYHFPIDVEAATNGALNVAYDQLNNMVVVNYDAYSLLQSTLLWYNVAEDRASFTVYPGVRYVRFLRARKFDLNDAWLPGAYFRFIDQNSNYVKFFEDSAELTAQLWRGLVQLNPQVTTRVLRVRPVFISTQVVPSITVESYAKLNTTPGSSGICTAQDEAGFIVTPNSKFGAFHDFQLSFTGVAVGEVTELTGLEVEYIEGGVHA